MNDEKLLGADAAAVVKAGSSDDDQLSHAERVIDELQELRLDIRCDMDEAIRADKRRPKAVMARLKAYEDVIGLIDVRLADLKRENATQSLSEASGSVPSAALKSSAKAEGK